MRKNETTDFLDVVIVMEPAGRPLKGMRICLTGHLSKERSEWVKLIEQAGGIFHKSVGYNTTHLCTNADWSKGSINGKVSSKYAKAQQHGVKIINEQDLVNLLVKEDEKT